MSILIVALYVDDLLFSGNDEIMIEEFRNTMMGRYEMSGIGLLNHFLRIEIYQVEDGVFISQKKYAENILMKFGMSGCKPMAIPLVVNEKLIKVGEEKNVDGSLYRSLVGNLSYLIATRSDKMYATSLLSRFVNNPSKNHLGVAKQVLRQMKGYLTVYLHTIPVVESSSVFGNRNDADAINNTMALTTQTMTKWMTVVMKTVLEDEREREWMREDDNGDEDGVRG
ncbi:uncharacterized protein LOC114320753 [Camellia sinensis]|uniref:uncharacterized protein LOC114320753 n=1 Tax=Camellia sinensis TaxID=4442 RepID=UPI0010358C8E|nr:uncharacterized protein LOC114320753 [Camellia sinensis]